jgi:hypothetical protein
MSTEFFYATGINPDPGWLAISRGLLQGFKPIIRNGLNPDVDAAASESLWDQGGIYVFPAAAATRTLSSSSANDTAAGTGARTVVVTGLDANYLPISETLTLNGQAAVTTLQQYLRIFGIVVNSAGSTGSNVGDVYCGSGAVAGGVPATVYARARPTWGASQGAQYTVPAGVTAYLVNVSASAMTSGVNQSTVMSLRRRFFDNPSVFVRSAPTVLGGQAVDLSGLLLTRFPEKTDLDIVVETTDNNIIAACQLRLLQVPGVDNPA